MTSPKDTPANYFNPLVQAKAVKNILREAELGDLEINPKSKEILQELSNSLEQTKRSTPRKTNIKHMPLLCTEAKINKVRQSQSIERDGKGVYLPHIPDDKIALPNFMLRSALFPVSESEEFEVKDKFVESLGNSGAVINGIPFIGYDRQILAILLREASKYPLANFNVYGYSDDEWISISMHQISKHLKVTPGANVYKAISSSLKRLSTTRIDVEVSGVVVNLRKLIQVKDSEERVINFRVPKEVAEFYGLNSWTRLPDSFVSHSKGYAGWLSAFYRTHSRSYPIHFSRLAELMGAQCRLSDFRKKVKAALEVLTKDSIDPELRVEKWSINKKDDKITVRCERWKPADDLSPEEHQLGLTRDKI